MCKKLKIVYIHYVLDLLNNPAKFQLNRVRTQNFNLLKVFDIAVSLKYALDQWKWYEQ